MASPWGGGAGRAAGAPRGVRPPGVTAGRQPGDTRNRHSHTWQRSHLQEHGGEGKGRRWGCPCATPGTRNGDKVPVVQMWVTGAVDVPCGCPCVRPSVLAVCPAAPWWVPGPRKHPHLASASLGHPVPVTLLVPVPRQCHTSLIAEPTPSPGPPLHRYRQCCWHAPCRAGGSPSSLPVPPSCSPVPGPALSPVLTVSPVTPCTAPCCRCLDACPPLRCHFCPSAAPVPALPRRGLCGCPPAAGTPGPSASPTPVQHPLPVPVSPGAGKSQVPALCAGKSRCPGPGAEKSRCQQAPSAAPGANKHRCG